MNRDFAAADGEEEIPDMTLVQAFVPYFALSIITLVVLLVKPLNTVLGQIKFGFAFPETSTGYGYVNKAVDCFSPLAPFTHCKYVLVCISRSLVLFIIKSMAGLVKVVRRECL